MSIRTGRYGLAKWNSNGLASPLDALISINGWKLSLKQDYEDVTCFQDENKVYVPGLRDISGSLTGFWNSDNIELVKATEAGTPGYLELTPNSQESSFLFSGPAYLDLDIDCTVNGAPKISSSFRAAGSWITPATT